MRKKKKDEAAIVPPRHMKCFKYLIRIILSCFPQHCVTFFSPSLCEGRDHWRIEIQPQHIEDVKKYFLGVPGFYFLSKIVGEKRLFTPVQQRRGRRKWPSRKNVSGAEAFPGGGAAAAARGRWVLNSAASVILAKFLRQFLREATWAADSCT